MGSEGTANRRFFHGPGVNNWDMTLKKITPIRENMAIEFRAELYNVFNHAQFANPSGLLPGPVGTLTAPLTNFGQITSIQNPDIPARVAQLSLKLNF